jgi:hypothetical protein
MLVALDEFPRETLAKFDLSLLGPSVASAPLAVGSRGPRRARSESRRGGSNPSGIPWHQEIQMYQSPCYIASDGGAVRAHWVVFAICTACSGKLVDGHPSGVAGPGDSGAGAASVTTDGASAGAGGAENADAGIVGTGGSSGAGGSTGGVHDPECPPASFQYDGPLKTKDVDGCTRVVLELPSHVVGSSCYLPFPPGADETVQYDSSYFFSMAGTERPLSFSRRTGDGPCNNSAVGPDAYGWIPHDCSSVELCAYNFCPMFLYDDRVIDVVMPCGWSLPS